jgi:ADP-heptose:LPS heptosyltransferase
VTWSLENSKNDEASKIRWELVPYFRGKCLDIGCGPYRVFPHFVGVDNGHHWGHFDNVRVDDAADLSQFGSAAWDMTFSSHLLEHFPYKDVPAVLREWMRVTKIGGHLVLYLPDEDQYPKVGKEFANADHKWDVSYDKLIAAMEKVDCGWDLVNYQVRAETDEYSLFFVFRKEQGRQHKFSFMNPKPAKTAAVVRYGAIGDMIQTSSILPGLKEQGFHITLYCQAGQGYETIKHDPHVDRFIVQEKDAVPPQFLREFLEYTSKRYDRFINLSESVEVSLLAAPGRTAWYWPNEVRAVHMDRNYIEWTHLLAGVPAPYRPAFYSTLEERAWARKQKERFGGRVVLWSLAGSSNHKVWPHLDEIVLRMMAQYPDVHVVTVGDETCKLLEQGFGRFDDEKNDLVETMSRVHLRSGKWTIRQSMAFAEVADLIIGTETGLLNAAGAMDTPKIITLSHSSPEMLTKHWKNTIALQQPAGVGCPKSPCRQLHGADRSDPWMDCPKHESGTALCQYEISPEMMWSAVQRVLGAQMQRAA